MKKDLDLVLYGATGFTGRYAVERLQKVAPPGLRWAIAGRRPPELEAVKRRFALAEDVEVLVANSDDPASVSAMAGRARVLLSTAGPYTRYGSPVVAACVQGRTHYADITGETVWVRRMIDAHHDDAVRTGTFLVPFAGYDSIPSDLATWMLVRHLREARGQGTHRVYGSFRSTGGFSGGTAASALEIGSMPPAEQRLMRSPFTLCPQREGTAGSSHDDEDPRGPLLRPDGGFDAPHFMGPINTRVVRRSEVLFAAAGHPYGASFHYQEGMAVPRRSRVAAWATTGVMGLFERVLATAAGRRALAQLVPASGEGPSEAAMDAGRTRATFFADGDAGARATLHIDFAGDPAIRFTVLALTECGLALAEDDGRLGVGVSGRGGVLTPSFALRECLVERLRAAGVTLQIEDRAP